MPMPLLPGQFCWCENATRDVAGAREFYGGLFNWESRAERLDPQGSYVLFSLGGQQVAGARPLDADDQGPGYWLSYLLSDDLDRGASAVESLGGRVLVAPTAIAGMGRFAVLADPRDTPFALWQGEAAPEAWYRAPGYPCWFELNTTSPEVADFYCRLLDWRAETRHYDRDYTVFFKEDIAVASVALLDAATLTDHWLPFFAVADCGTTLSRATEGGASVRLPETEVPGLGRYAVVVDPFGAAFAIKQNL